MYAAIGAIFTQCDFVHVSALPFVKINAEIFADRVNTIHGRKFAPENLVSSHNAKQPVDARIKLF